MSGGNTQHTKSVLVTVGAHFPNHKLINDSLSHLVEIPKVYASKGDWVVANKLVSYLKIRMAITKLKPHTSPGVVGIYPCLLIQGGT